MEISLLAARPQKMVGKYGRNKCLPSPEETVATGWKPEGLSDDEVEDGEAYHRTLYRDGDIENPAEWHKESIEKLVDLSIPHISQGSLVVDYGSGTGGSAIELLKALDRKGVSIELVMIDPLVSWFAKARQLLGERDGVHFELSIEQDHSGSTSFRRLEDMLHGRKADVIISSSTLHLVPARAMGDLAMQFAGSLVPGGVLVWDSGDLESDFRPRNSALLHDPYRFVRELLRDDESRKVLLSAMAKGDAERSERRLDRIFPLPFPVEVILDAMSEAGFSTEISEKVVNFSNEDAERFVLVPRLAEIAAPLLEGDGRTKAIRSALRYALSTIASQGRGSENCYRSHWIYGIHRI